MVSASARATVLNRFSHSAWSSQQFGVGVLDHLLQVGNFERPVLTVLLLFVGEELQQRAFVAAVGVLRVVEEREQLVKLGLSQRVVLVVVALVLLIVAPIQTAIVVLTRSTIATLRNSSSFVPPSLFVSVLR